MYRNKYLLGMSYEKNTVPGFFCLSFIKLPWRRNIIPADNIYDLSDEPSENGGSDRHSNKLDKASSQVA